MFLAEGTLSRRRLLWVERIFGVAATWRQGHRRNPNGVFENDW